MYNCIYLLLKTLKLGEGASRGDRDTKFGLEKRFPILEKKCIIRKKYRASGGALNSSRKKKIK